MDETSLRPVRRRPLASARAIAALMLREMATTHGRSPIGYLWAVLEPVAGIVLLTLVFSAIVYQPPLGTSFTLFYASGIVPFLFYSDITAKVTGALDFSRPLLAYPEVTFIDTLFARFLLSFLTQLLVGYILFTAILVIYDTRAVLDLGALFLGVAMAAALAFGIGTFNCFMTGILPSWHRVWGIVNRPLFLVSCVFYLYDTVPQPYRDWLWYNPLVHVLGQVRKGFYPYYEADYVSHLYVFGIALGLALLGLLSLRRSFRAIVNGEL